MIEIMKEEKEIQEALLKQYEDELFKLENGMGLARVMDKNSTRFAISNLKKHIVDIKIYIEIINEEIEELEEIAQ